MYYISKNLQILKKFKKPNYMKLAITNYIEKNNISPVYMKIPALIPESVISPEILFDKESKKELTRIWT